MVRPAARGMRDRTLRSRSSGRASANSIERTGVRVRRPGPSGRRSGRMFSGATGRAPVRSLQRACRREGRAGAALGSGAPSFHQDTRCDAFWFRCCSPALAPSPPRPPDDTPLPTLPYTPGLDPSFMDKTVDPCVDFYAFSCGGWQRQNPIPPDQATW